MRDLSRRASRQFVDAIFGAQIDAPVDVREATVAALRAWAAMGGVALSAPPLNAHAAALRELSRALEAAREDVLVRGVGLWDDAFRSFATLSRGWG
jgi:hypothetical protein